MILKVNMLGGGRTVEVRAYAEDYEEGFAYFRDVKIHHTQNNDGLIFCPDPVVNYANDDYVIFNCKVNFQEFCNQFYISSYSDPQEYRRVTHNCADAVKYALKLAGIDIPMSRLRLTQLHLDSNFAVPVMAISAADIFLAAKNYKINMLNSQKNQASIKFKIELATTKLNFWMRHSKNQRINSHVNIILKNVQDNIVTRPHHAELYLKVLIDTIDMLVGAATDLMSIKNYKCSSRFFKDRAMSYLRYESRTYVQALALMSKCLMITQAIIVALKLLNVELDDFVWSVISSLDVIILCDFFRKISAYSYAHSPVESVHTPLSHAMLDLAAGVKKNR